jgi:hypothetical protein
MVTPALNQQTPGKMVPFRVYLPWVSREETAKRLETHPELSESPKATPKHGVQAPPPASNPVHRLPGAKL